MKKLIFLLLVISATALEAQNYQYFTAKQGIPKAMEIAKEYFQSDSVELYEIRCLRWVYITYDKIAKYDSITPYKKSTGTSLYWYYLICNSKDSCFNFRIWNNHGIYEFDSVFYEKKYHKSYQPLNEENIIIDTDSLIKYIDTLCKFNLFYSHLYYSNPGPGPFGYEELPVWRYEEHSPNDMSGLVSWVNSQTCECKEIVLDVSEKNNNISQINFKSDPNTDNIIIETNSDLFQEAELNLYNQVGVLLFTDKMNDKSYQLSTYNYPSGLYLLQIKYGGNVITKTVMVVH